MPSVGFELRPGNGVCFTHTSIRFSRAGESPKIMPGWVHSNPVTIGRRKALGKAWIN